jgi:hypothetical protein
MSAHAQVGSVSPGKLSRSHARFESQCDRCHVSGGVSASQCLACHTKLADRIAKGVGFHATIGTRPCVDCHSDHKGRDFAMTPAPPSSFDHRLAAFPLDGRHNSLACARCHLTNQWVGIPTTCSRCHRDTAHRGQLGSECAKCHRADGWKPATRTAADHKVSLGGGHAKLTCIDCHRSGRHLVEPQICSHCHDQPHGGTRAPCETCHVVAAWQQVVYVHRTAAAKLEGAHQKLACLACHSTFRFTPTPTSCTGCHEQKRPHPPLGPCEQCHSAVTWRTTTFDHQAPSVGFGLDGAHVKTDCVGCHAFPIKWAQPRRTCTSCHADPHGGQFAAKGCPECHTTAAFRPSTIEASTHDAFGFSLRDAHRRTACSECHKSGVFVGIATACAACHPDPRHRGRFGTNCERCHDATTWSHTPAFDHRSTGFVLERGHAKVTCVQCHGQNGLALVGRAAPTACATCHATPHDRYFPSTCTSCHSTAAWRAVARFDHDRTAFPLELRHSTLHCGACHDAKRKPPIQRNCRSCHGDPHRGSNSWECEDCHRPDRWRIIRFDHDLTDYPLTGRHRLTGCGQCHTNPSWTGVRTDCVACHGFDRPNDSTHATEFHCEDCHTTSRWQTILKR